MKTDFQQRVAAALRSNPDENYRQVLVLAHAESERARSRNDRDPLFFAWNRVIRALWNIHDLEKERERNEEA